MRERIFGHFAGFGIEAADRVLFMRRIPDHVSPIDAQSVRARFGSGYLKFLERFGFGIKAPDLPSAPLAEPDDAVGIDLEALRLPFGRRIKLRDLAVLAHANDRAAVS